MALAAAATASSALLRKPLEDLYLAAKEEIQLKLKALQTEKKIRSLHKSIAAVQNVKTLWTYSKPIPLTKFYYPSRLRIDGSAKAIETITEISGDNNIVIEGTAGQGKSIFLRYLCLRELSLGLRIPIFVELRRMAQSSDILSFLKQAIRDYGIDCDDALFNYLAASGKVVLLADGFDEVDPGAVTQIVMQLEAFTRKFPECQIVVTSRPDSGINRSASFHVFQLAPLTPQDHEPFLAKIMGSPQRTKLIAEAIAKSPGEIPTLLYTPLLLTLLVLVYNATNEIPATFGAFYQELFHTLLTRHDKTKPGFSRKRASGLADSDLRRLFEAFCYFSRQQHKLVFDTKGLDTCLSKALRATSLAAKTEFFIQDMTKTACVMLEDGFEYHFIHKSVAEFHAAAFISRAPEDVAKRFYSAIQAGDVWRRWKQELVFLSEIDRSRYLKFYFVPAIKHDLNQLGFNIDKASSVTAWPAAKTVLNKINIQYLPRSKDRPAQLSFRTAADSCSTEGEDSLLNLIDLIDEDHYQLPAGTTMRLGNFADDANLQAAGIDIVPESR